ncbi:MAG: hypothetical protein ACRDFB_06065 [Rhabdochlamydiaceae bacterium]
MTSHYCIRCGIKMDYPDYEENDVRINMPCDVCREKIRRYWSPHDF